MPLDRLLGSWQVVMRHVALNEPAVGQQRYEQALDGAFVLLTSTNEHPDIPDALGMLTDTSYHYFDVRGVVRTFDVAITDAGWVMIRRDPDFWQRSSARFVGTDAMEGTGENSHDGGLTWQHDFDISYTRLT